MPEPRLTQSEIQFLQEALSSDFRMSNIRLREGEHQYSLAKAIAAFQLELYFPDVKDIIRKLYGEQQTSDVQLVRKVQTILKKMEKSNIVKSCRRRSLGNCRSTLFQASSSKTLTRTSQRWPRMNS